MHGVRSSTPYGCMASIVLTQHEHQSSGYYNLPSLPRPYNLSIVMAFSSFEQDSSEQLEQQQQETLAGPMDLSMLGIISPSEETSGSSMMLPLVHQLQHAILEATRSRIRANSLEVRK